MQSDGQPLPGVSYVMPVLNEVTEVRAAVGSLLDQDYTGPFEVILALGPSIDGTNELVAEMSAADPRIRAIDNPVGSTPAGLNVAIRASVHPVVIRVDAHSVLPTDYTRIAVRTLLESGADNVGGIMRAEGRTPFERAVALAYGSRVGLGGTPHHVGGTAGPAETAYLGVFRRERLFDVGLFDEGIKRGQDWELNRRLRQTGGTVWFTPELVVTYRPRPSLKRLVRQFVATGLWRGELARRFPANNGLRYFVPPAMVAAMALGHRRRPRRHRRRGARHPARLGTARVRGARRLPALRRPGVDRGGAPLRAADAPLVARRAALHPLRLGDRVHPRVPDPHVRADHPHGTVTE